MAGCRRATSRHRTAMAHTAIKIRSQFVNGVEEELHGRLRNGLSCGHRRRRADGLDGLSQLAHDLQGAPVSQLLGMTSASHVAISNVHCSHYLSRVLHEVITIIMLGQRLLESCTLCGESETSVVNCALSF